MKKYILLLLIVSVFTCSKKTQDLVVKVNIEGLQKGTVFLQRVIDTNLVTIDSVVINGNGEAPIELYSELDEPDLFYLLLDKNSKEEEQILFFADKGITEINTSLKNFVIGAEVKGSKQHEVLKDYRKLMSRLNNMNLELIKESLIAQKNGDSLLVDSIQKKQKGILKNRYLQTVNFAINHKDSEVAPYLALSEIYNANLGLLDTIHKSLTPKVKDSKYGIELEKFLEKRRETE